MQPAELSAAEDATRSTFDLTNGRDEMNLAEFPLFYLGQRVPVGVTTLQFEHSVFDPVRNRTQTRRLEIAGSQAYGLPTMRDADVLLALLLLAKQSNDFQSPTVQFSRYELVEILGWDHSGTSYQRVNESLKKWKTITLFFDDGWWDRENDQWTTEGFNLIDQISITYSKRHPKQQDLRLSSCTFNKRFFASMQSGNIKRLNLAELFSLSIPAAKQMYRFLDKRFYHTRRLEFDLKTFAFEHVGLSRNYMPTKLKEKLRPAINELVSIGFIEDAPDSQRYSKTGHGEWKIHFTRSDRKLISDVPLRGTKAERTENRLLIKELTDRGVTLAAARKLVEDPEIEHQRIRQKIEVLDWMIESKDVEAPARPGGWLRKAIEDDYQPPKGFQSAAEREEKRRRIDAYRAQREREQTEAKQAEQRQLEEKRRSDNEAWERVQDYLRKLPAQKRETLIDAAIEAPENQFLKKFASKFRHDPEPGSSGEVMYQMALRNHILPLIESQTA